MVRRQRQKTDGATERDRERGKKKKEQTNENSVQTFYGTFGLFSIAPKAATEFVPLQEHTRRHYCEIPPLEILTENPQCPAPLFFRGNNC